MIDLVVNLHDQSILPSSTVDVQVKSSSREARDFRWRKLKGITVPEERRRWFLDRKLILLYGDTKVNSRNKTKRPVTNNEIITSFNAQLTDIIVYHYQQSDIAIPLLQHLHE